MTDGHTREVWLLLRSRLPVDVAREVVCYLPTCLHCKRPYVGAWPACQVCWPVVQWSPLFMS